MKLKSLILAATLPLSFLLACGGTASDSGDENGSSTPGDGDGDASPPSSSDGKEEVCEEFCTALSECGASEVDTCTTSCTEGNATSLSGQEVINSCFDADLCSADVSELESVDALLCVITGLEDVELSEEAETYCSESVDTINRCLGSTPEDLGLGSCEDSIGIASDELLEGINECAQEECENVETCLFLEVLKSVPLETLVELDSEETPSPAVLADLLPIFIVFGQLGLSDSSFEDIPTAPPGPGGASGR